MAPPLSSVATTHHHPPSCGEMCVRVCVCARFIFPRWSWWSCGMYHTALHYFGPTQLGGTAGVVGCAFQVRRSGAANLIDFAGLVFCVCAAVCVGGRVCFGVGGASPPSTRPSTFFTPAPTTKRVGGVGDFMLVRFRSGCCAFSSSISGFSSLSSFFLFFFFLLKVEGGRRGR